MSYKVINLRQIDSTNEYVKRLDRVDQTHGKAVVAEMQTEGRGRLGKNWESVEGKGLYFSLIVDLKIPLQELCKITLVTGLKISECFEKNNWVENVALKWPNDLFVEGKKLGGILVETVDVQPGAAKIIIGVGLNVLHEKKDFSKDLNESATSISICGNCKSKVEIQTIFHAVYMELIAMSDEINSESSRLKGWFDDMLMSWKKRDILAGKKVTMVANNGEIVQGVARGIDMSGRMFLEDDSGKLHNVISGDLRLQNTSSHHL